MRDYFVFLFCLIYFLLMIRRPPSTTRPATLFPYTPLCRSLERAQAPVRAAARELGRLRQEADVQGRRRVAAHTEIDRAFAGGEGSAGRSEEHTSELQSLMRISYAVF